MRLRPQLSLTLAFTFVVCAGCTGASPNGAVVGPSPKVEATVAPEPERTETPPVSAAERATRCGRAFVRTHDRDAVEKRLRVRLTRMLRGAGMESLGGDHEWFSASAVFRRPSASVALYPLELTCSRAPVRAAEVDVFHGLRVRVGKLYGSHGARFQCGNVVHEVSADRRTDVERVLTALTGALSHCD